MLAGYQEDVWRQEKHFPPPDIFSSKFGCKQCCGAGAKIKFPPRAEITNCGSGSFLLRKSWWLEGIQD